MKTRVAEPLKRGKSLAPVNQVTVVLRVALTAFFGDRYYGHCVLAAIRLEDAEGETPEMVHEVH